MEELAPQVMGFAELPVEGEVSVLVVHDHGMVQLGEMEADLVLPASVDSHLNETRSRQLLLDFVLGQGSDRSPLTSWQGEVDSPRLRMKFAYYQSEIFLVHFSLLKFLL